MCVTHYFDDYATCEPSYAGMSGQNLLILIHTALGMHLSSEKHVPMSLFFVFLSVVSDFVRFAARRIITMRPKLGRLENIVATLAAAVAAGAMSHGLAATACAANSSSSSAPSASAPGWAGPLNDDAFGSGALGGGALGGGALCCILTPKRWW